MTSKSNQDIHRLNYAGAEHLQMPGHRHIISCDARAMAAFIEPRTRGCVQSDLLVPLRRSSLASWATIPTIGATAPTSNHDPPSFMLEPLPQRPYSYHHHNHNQQHLPSRCHRTDVCRLEVPTPSAESGLDIAAANSIDCSLVSDPKEITTISPTVAPTVVSSVTRLAGISSDTIVCLTENLADSINNPTAPHQLQQIHNHGVACTYTLTPLDSTGPLPLQYTLRTVGALPMHTINYASNSIDEAMLLFRTLGVLTMLFGLIAMLYLLISGNAPSAKAFASLGGLWLSVAVLIVTFIALAILHWRNVSLSADALVAQSRLTSANSSGSEIDSPDGSPPSRRHAPSLIAGHLDFGLLRLQLQRQIHRNEQILIKLPGCDEMIIGKRCSGSSSSLALDEVVVSSPTPCVADLPQLVLGLRTH
ncbi:hypothetical protein BASA61_007482 [Batrachochytrium salamandrivorans]|nr:hypothetical protein BASA60_009764 [Batrachochytrium salamandrivorans]KAH6584395.1 hypothetical protein BASA61_007482 [Batrachochytrium salamandrivorans]KAJ1339939.1 hypothetical protein BSLG_005474 [Batrachochytrium salamandrivorans]